MKKARIGLVGLGWGKNYLGSYLRHPDVEHVGLCDISEEKLKDARIQHGITRLYTSLDDMIASNEFDAIHIMTQIPLHAEQSVRVLDAGLHCACTLPMGANLKEMASVAAAVKRNRGHYMLMEPNAYSPETRYLKKLYENGDMGRIQYLRGIQTYFLDNSPIPFWQGMPPMLYISHVLAPLLAITGARCTAITCLGSGSMREDLKAVHKNPFPIEIALLELDLPGVVAEIEILFYNTAITGAESFEVYGEKMSFRNGTLTRLVDPKGYFSNEMTTEPIERSKIIEALSISGPLQMLLGHDQRLEYAGLAHEFVRSIVEDRESELNATRSFDINAPGLYAHMSAMNKGALIQVPTFAEFSDHSQP